MRVHAWLWLILLAIGFVGGPSHAASVAFGSASANTLSATITPDAADIDTSVSVWMGAVYQGALFLRNGTAWELYTGGPFPVAIRDQKLIASTPVTVVDQIDISPLVGLELYVGYGLSVADMLNSPGKMAKIHTVSVSVPVPVPEPESESDHHH